MSDCIRSQGSNQLRDTKLRVINIPICWPRSLLAYATRYISFISACDCDGQHGLYEVDERVEKKGRAFPSCSIIRTRPSRFLAPNSNPTIPMCSHVGDDIRLLGGKIRRREREIENGREMAWMDNWREKDPLHRTTARRCSKGTRSVVCSDTQ